MACGSGYRSFMPARFATDSIVKFRVKPGTEVRRGVVEEKAEEQQ